MPMVMFYKNYDTGGFFDEYFTEEGDPRPGASLLLKRIEDLPRGELLRRQKATEARLFQMGVTFTSTAKTRARSGFSPSTSSPASSSPKNGTSSSAG